MLHDEWIAKAEIHTENGENWILDYFIQVFESVDDDTKVYGVRVDKSTPEGVLNEREETMAITESHEEALQIANAFAKGCVPPVVLLEMADEWCYNHSPVVH